MRYSIFFLCAFLFIACQPQPTYDLVLQNGLIYDGDGGTPYLGDVAINADTIAAIGDANTLQGQKVVPINGMAVAPGFINMLSWANESLIEDGRSMSDIVQGVTLEVLGEGFSMGWLFPWGLRGECLPHQNAHPTRLLHRPFPCCDRFSDPAPAQTTSMLRSFPPSPSER